jgi:hypothetical protein
MMSSKHVRHCFCASWIANIAARFKHSLVTRSRVRFKCVVVFRSMNESHKGTKGFRDIPELLKYLRNRCDSCVIHRNAEREGERIYCARLYSRATCCIPRFHLFMHSCETFATGNNLIAVDARKRAAFWWFLHAKSLLGKRSKEVSQ